MDSLRLVQHTLRHTLHSLILILIVACSKLPAILTMGKGGQQGQQRLYTGKLRGRKRQRYHGNELHSAVIECNVKTVRAMLKTLTDQLKALMNEKDNLGYTPVFWCFDTTKTAKLKTKQAKSYLKILTYFLNHPYCDLATVDNCSKHLLHWAVITKNLEAVRLILDKLASSPEEQSKRLINQRNCFGYTPLHYLIFDKLNIFNEEKALAILQQFADHGANINAKDLDERTLLDWVADYSNNPKFMQMKPLERLKEQLESYKDKRLSAGTRLCSGICRRHGAPNRSVLGVREDLSTGSTSKLPAECAFCRKSKEPLSPFLSTHAKLDASQATPAKTPDQPYLGLDLDEGAQERGLLKEATFDHLNEQMNRLQEPILQEYKEEVAIITELFDFYPYHNILSEAYQANKIINSATAFSHFNEGKQEKDLFAHPQQDDASKPLKTCEARH